MSALKSLQLSLATVNARLVIGPFGEPKAMEKTAINLERIFGEGRKPDPEIVMKTLRRFIETGSLSGYCDIKNACFGVLMPIQDGKTLVGYRSRFEALLGIVDQYHRDQ